MNNQKRVALIEQRLTELFNPDYLKITDESHHHAGHVGAKDGRGHFAIQISASAFNDKKQLERHRMIYTALDDLMKTDIHALKISIIENSAS